MARKARRPHTSSLTLRRARGRYLEAVEFADRTSEFRREALISDAVWIIVDNKVLNTAGKPTIIAAAGARFDYSEAAVIFTFCVVAKRYRGRGLQRRLIAARIRWARKFGATAVTTYAAAHNTPSLVTLLKAGFVPDRMMYADEFVHVTRKLPSKKVTA
jgi:GNAT superfamily N-acetyltransferase